MVLGALSTILQKSPHTDIPSLGLTSLFGPFNQFLGPDAVIAVFNEPAVFSSWCPHSRSPKVGHPYTLEYCRSMHPLAVVLQKPESLWSYRLID